MNIRQIVQKEERGRGRERTEGAEKDVERSLWFEQKRNNGDSKEDNLSGVEK